MTLAAESELGGLFFNTQDAIILRTTLEELGHPQPPTPIKTENYTAAGIVNTYFKQRKSKVIDVSFLGQG